MPHVGKARVTGCAKWKAAKCLMFQHLYTQEVYGNAGPNPRDLPLCQTSLLHSPCRVADTKTRELQRASHRTRTPQGSGFWQLRSTHAHRHLELHNWAATDKAAFQLLTNLSWAFTPLIYKMGAFLQPSTKSSYSLASFLENLSLILSPTLQDFSPRWSKINANSKCSLY